MHAADLHQPLFQQRTNPQRQYQRQQYPDGALNDRQQRHFIAADRQHGVIHKIDDLRPEPGYIQGDAEPHQEGEGFLETRQHALDIAVAGKDAAHDVETQSDQRERPDQWNRQAKQIDVQVIAEKQWFCCNDQQQSQEWRQHPTETVEPQSDHAQLRLPFAEQQTQAACHQPANQQAPGQRADLPGDARHSHV